MAYDEELADRVRVLLAGEEGLTERKMFGGLAFMVNGNMACGIVRDDLMLRLGAEGAEEALRHRGIRQMDFTGRPMTGMVYVERGALDDPQLRGWVQRARDFARSLPPKKPK